MNDIAENLRLLCSYRPSISQVGRDLEVNRSQFNRYLAGTSLPRPALLRRICDYFGVEPYEMSMPAAEFARIVQLRGLEGDSPMRRMRSQLERVMALNDSRIRHLAGLFWEYSWSMSQEGKVVRALISFRQEDGQMVYRRLERIGRHDAPVGRHYRYQGAALMTGDRIFMSDYEFTAGVELTQTVLYPDYALRWMRLHGVRLGVSADHRHIPCAVRVCFERVPKGLGVMGALRRCGLFEPMHPEIPAHVRPMIDNARSGPQKFEAYGR